ncbi:MAG: glycosyltransferase family 2 protein, partial [Actinobacteria bacterium]|nr:glycosyltransferase family 2 protein [Actinomycetota bacterium]
MVSVERGFQNPYCRILLIAFSVTALLVLMCLAGWEFVRQQRRKSYAGSEQTAASQLGQGVSVVVPSYNEEVVIVASLQALLALRFARHEVIVVDDGSTDAMFERLRRAFDLVEVQREVPSDVATRGAIVDVHVPRDGRTRLVVVRKENSGRSDSINVGVNAALESLVVFIDADSILDPDALISVTKPFADDPTRVVATGGVVRAVNGCRVMDGRLVEVRLDTSWLARIQVV